MDFVAGVGFRFFAFGFRLIVGGFRGFRLLAGPFLMCVLTFLILSVICTAFLQCDRNCVYAFVTF